MCALRRSTGGLLLTTLPGSNKQQPEGYSTIMLYYHFREWWSLLSYCTTIDMWKNLNHTIRDKWILPHKSCLKSFRQRCLRCLQGTEIRLWFYWRNFFYDAHCNPCVCCDYLHQCVVSVASFSPASDPQFYAPCKTVTHSWSHFYHIPVIQKSPLNEKLSDNSSWSDQNLCQVTHFMTVMSPPV